MGPGVRNGLLGAKQTTGPAGRLPASPLNRLVSFHPVACRIAVDNSVEAHARARAHTHTHTHRVNEYFRDTETTNAHCLGWSHILSEPLHMWACDRQLILVHPHQSKLNRPPGRWRQAIQTHQQGSTNEFSTSSPTRCFSLVLLT